MTKGNNNISMLVKLPEIYVSFSIPYIEFDNFEQVIRNLSPMIEVLNVTPNNNSYRKYIDANRWKKLIISYLPNIRIFDIQINTSISINVDNSILQTQINQCSTSFGTE